MKLVDSAAMQQIDRRAQDEYGIPSLVLMEGAGLLAWQELKRVIDRSGLAVPRARVCVVAGKGNNGGDALVMARYAIVAGFTVRVVLAVAEQELGEQALLHARIVRSLGAGIAVWGDPTASDAIAAADLVIDGLSGTGIRGALRAPLDACCGAVNASDARVVAVDAPSGLSDEWRPGMPVVQADWTLTIGLPKSCLYGPLARTSCGEIRIIDVAFPPDLLADPALRGELLDRADLFRLLPPLDPDAYKNRRGVVSVFAGAIGTTGAAILAAEASQRCRAGLVTVHVDDAIYPVIASSVRSVMVRPLSPQAVGSLRADAVVIGPGWGMGEARAGLLSSLLETAPCGVIDADGLNLLAASASRRTLTDRWVLTPHPGELARLLGSPARPVLETFFDSVRECARIWGAVVVGKSHTSVIAHPDGRFAVVDGLNPALGTGGSGDVLAGAIAGLIAGGMESWDAACAGVVAHQAAGFELRRRVGLFLAEELPAELGRIVDVRQGVR